MSLRVNQAVKTHNGTPIHRVRFDSVQAGDRIVHIPSGELGLVEAVEGNRGTVDATIVFAGGRRITRRTWASKSLWKVVATEAANQQFVVHVGCGLPAAGLSR